MEFKLVTEKDNLEYLKQVSKPFDFNSYTNEEIKKIENNITNYVFEQQAFGVAGVQLSFPYRVFGVYVDEGDFRVMFNPSLLKILDDTNVNETEGCLSFPELFLNIGRSKRILIEYHDLENKLNTTELSDYYARGFLHELDHLNGSVFIDYVGKLSLKLARKKVVKYNKRKSFNRGIN